MTQKFNYSVFFVFLLFALCLRFFSFFPSVINHDESTYIYMAYELLEGKTIFVDYIDMKPIGIFLIYAFAILAFGKSIFLMRLFATIILVLTAFLMYKTSLKLINDKKSAIASGIIYLFLTSFYTQWGVSPNTELYFNFFTILALLCLLNNRSMLLYLLGGLLLGLGFITKIVVVFDLAAFGSFLLIRAVFYKEGRNRFFINALSICTGFLIPFGLVHLYYYYSGFWEEFVFITYKAASNYPIERKLNKILQFIADFHLRYLPITFFFYYALFDKSINNNAQNRFKQLIIIWSVFVLIVVLLPGKRHAHYFIQLFLPFSLLAGSFFQAGRKIPKLLDKIKLKPTGLILIAVLMIVNFVLKKQDFFDKPDYPKLISNHLKQDLNREDKIYTGNYSHIIYFLTEKSSPVKYPHSSIIHMEEHINVFQIDVNQEMQYIVNSEPKYIIIENDYPYQKLNQYIDKYYLVDKIFKETVKVYKRK